MRRTIVPLALVLALATGAVLAETRLIALAPVRDPGKDPHANANADTVRRFYAAVNGALVTGETDPVGTLVADDFVDHVPRPGVTADRAGLLGVLRALPVTFPAIRLSVVNLVAAADRVTVLVGGEGMGGESVAGLPAAGRLWGTVDIFRLRAGRIVEHWGDAAGLALIEARLAVTVPVDPPRMKSVGVTRQEDASDAPRQVVTDGPTILLVEAGTLTVVLDQNARGPATIVRPPQASRSLSPGESVDLAAGQALVLSRGEAYRVLNAGDAPARTLTVWMAEGGTAGEADLPDGRPHGSALAGTPPTLAGGLVTALPSGAAAVTIGRATLAAGATLEPHRVGDAELVVVEAGRLALAVDGGRAWIRNATTDTIDADGEAMLSTGAGAALDAGAMVTYRNAGEVPLVLLLVAITDVAAAATPTGAA